MKRSPILIILVAALITAVLDAIAAIVFLGARPAILFKYIATGIFGKESLSGGGDMIIWGVILHFLIALIWTILFYFVYKHFALVGKYRLITSMLYGILIWLVMNLVVLPLSNVPPPTITLASALKGAAILIGAVALPLTLIFSYYFKGKGKLQTEF